MVVRPSWALGCVALCAVLAAGCSGPPATKTGSDGATVAEAAAPPAGAAKGAGDAADSSDAGATDAGDPAVSAEPPLPFTHRDERTLDQDHPYRDRHGAADCETDCAVHEAGYKWAALHSLHDSHYCAGRTTAFVAGCLAYVGDHRRG